MVCERARERASKRVRECVWCEVLRVGGGEGTVSYSYSYVDAATTHLVKINGSAN